MMQRFVRRSGLLAALCAALPAGGCAVMSESECVNADWYAVGEQDGRAGRQPSRIARYHDACAQYGVTPSRTEYEAGRDRGLDFYCTEFNGYQVARGGSRYQGVCPPGLEPYFMDGYNVGEQVWRAVDRVRQVEYRMDEERDRIRDLKREIARLESPGDPDREDRQDSRDSAAGDAEAIRDKYRELGRAEGALERLDDELLGAVIDYRRAADAARRRGFPEDYEY